MTSKLLNEIFEGGNGIVFASDWVYDKEDDSYLLEISPNLIFECFWMVGASSGNNLIIIDECYEDPKMEGGLQLRRRGQFYFATAYQSRCEIEHLIIPRIWREWH